MATETSWGSGVYVEGEARAPDAPTYQSHGIEQINIGIQGVVENGNGPNVKYAIQLEENSVTPADSYLPADGDASNLQTNGVFQTAATWGDVFAITELTSGSVYRFRCYSQNEAGDPSAGTVGSWSANMSPDLNLDWSDWSSTDTYDVTSGNTTASSVTMTGTQRTVKISFTLTNKDSTTSSVDVEYSTDGTTYSTCTQVTAQATAAKKIKVDTTANTLESLDDDSLFLKFYGQEGNKITLSSSEDAGNDGVYTISSATTKILTLTEALTTDNDHDESMLVTGGENINSLSTSSTGTSHEFLWDTSDLGTSYYGTTITAKITPYDSTSQGGDADTAATSSSGTVNNVPSAPTLLTEIREVSWDKDTTPEFIAEMSDIILGDELYFAISFTDADGTETIYESDESTSGWYYEQDRDDAEGSTTPGNTTNWTAMTYAGVDKQYVPPIYQGQEEKSTRNRVRYILPAGNALTADTAYTVKIKQGELHNDNT